MSKRILPKYIQVVNGIVYFRRVRRVAGKQKTTRWEMPPLESPLFAKRYEELSQDRETKGPTKGSVKELIVLYKQTDEYKQLKDSTKKLREQYIKFIEDNYGKKSYSGLTKGKAKEYRGKLSSTPGKANLFVAVMSLLWKTGIDLDKTQFNPWAGIKPLKLGEHEPWPEELIVKAMDAAEPMTRLGIALLLYTGQRIGDVCAMQRSQIKDDVIEVTQIKTGKTVWIPMHFKLKEELKRVNPHAKWLLYNDFGKQMSYSAMNERMQNLRGKITLEYTWHGLRKNSVNALLEAGCTPAEVASITGQTMQMIEHYAKGMNTRKMAQTAMKKWEQA